MSEVRTFRSGQQDKQPEEQHECQNDHEIGCQVDVLVQAFSAIMSLSLDFAHIVSHLFDLPVGDSAIEQFCLSIQQDVVVFLVAEMKH